MTCMLSQSTCALLENFPAFSFKFICAVFIAASSLKGKPNLIIVFRVWPRDDYAD